MVFNFLERVILTGAVAFPFGNRAIIVISRFAHLGYAATLEYWTPPAICEGFYV